MARTEVAAKSPIAALSAPANKSAPASALDGLAEDDTSPAGSEPAGATASEQVSVRADPTGSAVDPMGDEPRALTGDEPNAGAETSRDPFSDLPASLRGSPHLKNVRDLRSLAERLHDLGEKYARVEDLMHKRVADYDEKDARRVIELGFGPDVPRDVDAADLRTPEMPEGMAYDQGLDRAIREAAVKHRIPMRYVRPLAKVYVEQLAARYGQMVADRQARAEADHRTLRDEWGDSFDANVGHARRAVRAYGGPDLVALMDDPRFGSNPAVARAFAAVGKSLAEDSLVDGKSGDLLSASDALNSIVARKSDAGFWTSLNDRRDPGHAAALEEWNRLHQAAYVGRS